MTAVALAATAPIACGSPAPSEQPAARPASTREPVSFAYRSTQQKAFDSRSTRGRATAVLFVTTFDLASQVAARRVNSLVHGHRPRINAGAVVLETQDYAVLAEAFRTSLGLSYPVCLADAATREGTGPFGRLDRVPTVVVLDRDGAEVWRKEGLASTGEMSKALTLASRRGSPIAD